MPSKNAESRIYIISGEVSGDMHAANLMHAMKKIDSGIRFRGLGGERMKEEGAELFLHLNNLSFMGFVEVIKHLPLILRNLAQTKNDILQFKPDAIILVDFPGFNFRMAKWAKQQNIPVIYYIAPQLWAWKEGRINKVKAYVDRLHVILPFEKDFYERHAIHAYYFGHPLLDELNRRRDKGLITQRIERSDRRAPIIALLPGSRSQEIKRCLPVMIDTVKRITGAKCYIAAVPAFPASYYKELLNGYEAELYYGKTYETIVHADAAMVTSGTATLETALLKTPLLVMYRSNPLSVWLARKLVKVKFISLVNLILNRLVVKEFIQQDANPEELSKELHALLYDEATRLAQQNACLELSKLLGEAGCSHQNAASMLAFIYHRK